MRSALRLFAVTSLFLSLAVAGWGRTRPHYGGTLRIETQRQSFDQSSPAYPLVAETLTGVDDEGNAVPKLALRWESQSGDRRWQFWLRSGVKWHDGTALDAAEVAKLFAGRTGAPWRTVRAVGDVLVFESDVPMPELAIRLAQPKYAVVREGSNGLLQGTGPMKITYWAPQSQITLGVFDDYWGPRTFVDSIEISLSRSLRDQLLDIGIGRADLMQVPAEILRRSQSDHVRISSAENAELVAIRFDSRVQDERIRHGIAASIDRSALLNFIFQKQGTVAGALLPQWLTGYATLFPIQQRLQQARELRDIFNSVAPMTIGYPAGDGALQLVAERIALNARDAGFNVQPVPLGGTRTDMTVTRANLPSPIPFVALVELADRFDIDLGKTDGDPESLYRAENEIVKSAQVIPLLYLPRSYATRDRVQGVRVNLDGTAPLENAFVEDRK